MPLFADSFQAIIYDREMRKNVKLSQIVTAATKAGIKTPWTVMAKVESRLHKVPSTHVW